jgi:hypothetical protein
MSGSGGISLDQSEFSPIGLEEFLADMKRLERAPLWLNLPLTSMPIIRAVKCEVYGSPIRDTLMFKTAPDDYMAVLLSSFTICRATLDRKSEIVMSYQLTPKSGPPFIISTAAPYPNL